jgi:hypothetical protein
MSINLPLADPYGDGMQITDAARLDAVRHELALAASPRDVTAVESWLHDAHRTRMRLHQARPWINAAFALCAERRTELAREAGKATPGLSGIPDRR